MFMIARREQHFSAIWPDFSALRSSMLYVEIKNNFLIVGLEFRITMINVPKKLTSTSKRERLT